MLVLLIRVIYDVHRCHDFVWSDMHTKFHEDRCMCSSNIKIISQKF
jgi:hypothetical protein